MNAEEVATEFMLTLRYAQFTSDGHVDYWKIHGRTVARRTASQVWASANRPSNFGSPMEVYSETPWSWGVSRDAFVNAVAPLVSVDRRGGRMFLVPTMSEMTAAFAVTKSNDVEVISQAIGLNDTDVLLAERLWTRTSRSRPHECRPHHVSEADYVALRTAARQSDIGYVCTLLDAGIPAAAVIQLCAIPPMPVEYAIAMVGETP